ncbi:filamentous hemagglutinin N-terminal domain-containing protein [Salmonella enterica]|nr:filamentous hemagglutinin N-terminal domain-containing protein [Salmonella enterica]
MNKIYRLKFDKRRNELVVVSEIAAGTGKKKNTGHIADLCDVSTFRKLVGTLTPLAFLTGLIISLFPVVALANPDLPTGGQIVGGRGSISTSGNQMTIHQQTQNMATNWQSFDIGKNNTVQFVQPDSSSVALNRVTGASGSQIMGTLTANGQVFILNPNGVLFGKDARVSVAGLVASTKNINTADFMKGQYTLSGEGNPGAQVINQGSLTTTKGGYIVLAADQVKNSGTITTPSGKTVLAAGKTVTLQLDNGGLTSVSVDGSVVNALVDNRGLISATNGQVFLTARGKDMLLNAVVNNSGTIEAKGLESRGGEIVLNGGDSGVVNQTGQLLADSHAGPGGKITVEGQNIHLAANSRTSATGKTGGGEVYVGGGWQGKDSHIRNASKVVMDKTATVDVSATDAGNGGTAVLWSDDYTNFRGAILAKGGALSGDGGRVETSSHNNLQASGDVDTSASAGKGGEWLLDPADVVIDDDGGDIGTYSEHDSVFIPKADIAHISIASIQEQLNKGGNVTVQTSGFGGNKPGDIVVDGSIHKTGSGDATLTLVADRGIMINAVSAGRDEKKSIDSTEGKLNIKLLAGGSSEGAVFLGGKFDTHGGDFSIGAVTGDNGQAKHAVAVRVKGFADIKTGAGNFTIENVAAIDASHLKNMYMAKGYKGYDSGNGFYTGFTQGDRSFTDYLDGINIWGKITSGGDINLQSDQIFMGDGSYLTGKTIDIKSSNNLFGDYGDAGVLFQKAYIEATGGNVNIQSKGSGSGIELAGDNEKQTKMKASGEIILDGITNNSDKVLRDYKVFGVKVYASDLLAKHIKVKGTSTSKNESDKDKHFGVFLNKVNMNTSAPQDGTISIEGKAESGNGVQVAGNTSLKDATVNGKSGSGIGANISGGIDGGEVTGDSASGDGVVLAKGADVHKAVVKGSSTTGRGVYVADPDVVLADSTVEGHSEKGTGVQLNKASMSGGRLTATSVEGTGLRVEEGSSADNVVISAQTVTGKAIDGENGALTTTGTSISTVGEPGNTNISENAKPVPGGTPSGAVAEALGNKLSESISALQKTLDTKLADLDGLQQTMTTLQMQFDQAVRTGAIGQVDLKRLETAMNGLSDRLNTAAELKDAFGALKTDTGSLEERLKKSDVLSAEIQGLTLPAGGDISAVAAELGAAKALQSATVSLQASLAARTEENGKVRLRLDSLKQRLKEAQEKGTAGGAVLAEMQTQLEGLERQQRSYGESLVHFRQSLATVSQDGSRPVTSRQESVDRLQTALSGVSGISDMQVSTLGEQLQQAMIGYAQVVVTAQGQGGVNAQTSLQNRDQQDGFRAGGEPPVPVRGYQTQPQSVDIHLCDSDRCRLITLDVGKPSQVAMAEVTESRPDGK